MTLAGFLARLAAVFDSADVPYMLAGSLASALHGEPRATQDVYIVIHTDPDGHDRLLSELPKPTILTARRRSRRWR
jgi:hypothetical protein